MHVCLVFGEGMKVLRRCVCHVRLSIHSYRYSSVMLTLHQNTTRPWPSPTNQLQFAPLPTTTIVTRIIKLLPRCRISSSSDNGSSAGRIKRLVLTQEGRTKLNVNPDREFYSSPRFVTHVDDNFISTLTNLYRERLRGEFEIFDLMSSWVSHLPREIKYKKVVGHGLNAQELAKNQRLDYFVVKDLNEDQSFETESCSFDAVLCTVSVQYLQQPEKVFAEVFRVLRPGGVFIVSFSNRVFYEKAIRAWREESEYGRVQLVVQYFQCVEGFTEAQVIRKVAAPPDAGGGDRDQDMTTMRSQSPFNWIIKLLGSFSGPSDPFYAVLAYKNFKPVYE